MPKTTMHKYDRLVFGQDDIRLSRQITDIDTITKPFAKEALRKIISGFVPLPEIRDMISDRFSLLYISAIEDDCKSDGIIPVLFHGKRKNDGTRDISLSHHPSARPE